MSPPCLRRLGGCRAVLVSLLSASTAVALLQLALWSRVAPPRQITDAPETDHGPVTEAGRWEVPVPEEGGRWARVLLLAYMRTGSSFTGELLTLHHDFNYLFEPLWRFRQQMSMPGFSDLEMDESRAGYLSALFDCDPLLTWDALRDKFVDRVRFELPECRRRHLLAKVIRAPGETLRLLMHKQQNLKIIHLVRDPRATVSSRSQVGAKDSAALYCTEIRQHLNVTDQLTAAERARYTLVRYEDLADRSTMSSELERLYRFIGVPLPQDALQHYLRTHYQSNNTKRVRVHSVKRSKSSLDAERQTDIGPNYQSNNTKRTRVHTVKGKKDFDTKRQANFDPNAWKNKLSAERLRTIEYECEDILKRFGYGFTQLM